MDKTQSDQIAVMIDAIKNKLRVASGAAIKPEHFDGDKLEDLKDLYELVESKDRFSVSEIDAIVSELGKLRKS